jgi:DNA-binding transcriptional MocR family regulator
VTARPSTGYLPVVGRLRERLESAEFPPGSDLSSASMLAAEFGVRAATVRRALSELDRLGLTGGRRGGRGSSRVLPPTPDRGDGERGGVMVDADVHPAGVGGEVMNALGNGKVHARPCGEEAVVLDPTGSPFGRHSRPAAGSCPSCSFFLASMLITGSPASW